MATTGAPQRNIETARKGYEAFDRADMDGAMATITDDCVWHGGVSGPLAGDYKGKAAILEFFMKFGRLTEGTYRSEIHDILTNDQHTVVMGTSTITRQGKTRKDRFVDTIHPAGDGRCKEFWRFVEDQIGFEEFLES